MGSTLFDGAFSEGSLHEQAEASQPAICLKNRTGVSATKAR
jgi:hypothetical protein